MKKDIYKKTKRTVLKIRSSSSLRRYLPLLVRVHYDVVKNWRSAKVWGVGVMMMVALFGALLATQLIVPTSSALGGNILPVLEVAQTGNLIVAKSTRQGMSVSNYQYVFIRSNESCNSSQFGVVERLGWVTYYRGSSHELTDNNKAGWQICFRAQNQANSRWGYKPKTVQRFTLPPTINVKQDKKLVVATATATGNKAVADWQRVVIQRTQSCNFERFQSRAVKAGSTLVLTNNTLVGKKACFRARYTTAPSWGYGSHIVVAVNFNALVAPVLDSYQNNKVIRARTTTTQSVRNWQNIIIDSTDTCNSRVFRYASTPIGSVPVYQSGSTIVLASNKDFGKKACFRAQGNSSSLWGYTDLIIARADFAKPTVIVNQDKALLSASSSDDVEASTWRFIIIPSNTTCLNSLFTSTSPSNKVKFTGAGNSYTLPGERYKGDKICFRVRTTVSLVWGLGEKEIEAVNETAATATASNTSTSDSSSGSTADSSSNTDSSSNDTTGANNDRTTSENDSTTPAATNEDPVITTADDSTATEEADSSSEAGKVEEVTDTGFGDESLNLPQLAGFILIAGAILGTARILLIKHHYKR